MKKLLYVFIFVIIIAIALTGCSSSENKENSKKYADEFALYQDDFVLICNTLERKFINSDNEIFDTIIENDKIIALTDIELTEDEITALNNIRELMNGDFEYINFTINNISFGGIENKMYVYSRDGKKPDFFYHINDGSVAKLNTYKLCKNWYYLTD